MGNDNGIEPPIPEIVSISSNKNYSTWTSDDLSIYKEIWNQNLYGMVGALIQDTIYICGGGKKISGKYLEAYASTDKCQTFELKSYSWAELDLTLTQERSFAQSLMLDNDTWFIMGGQDFHERSTHSTEYLGSNSTGFVPGIAMPEMLAKQCAKMINSSQLFITGGRDNSTDVIARGKSPVIK